jgi:chorismate mutase
MSDEIEEYRKKIDDTDLKIVELLNLRAIFADEIGGIKRKLGLPVYVPSREEQVIENVTKKNKGPLSDSAISRLYERVIDESRGLERENYENSLKRK